jgi:uncharacterized protein (DUF2252 family)
MTGMHSVTRAILDDNRGRDTQRLRLKLAAIRADPFAFFRGTSALFYHTLELPPALQASPAVLACGDLHLQNFGSYKGDNRLVYFDVNDFDEGCVAPLAFELVRFLTSILAGAQVLGIHEKVANRLVAAFIETYAANIVSTKPRWVERPLATGPVRTLLRKVKGRHRRDLIAARTRRKAGKLCLIIDGKRTLAATSRQRAHVKAILAAHAQAHEAADFFEPVDMALRIAGNGSLGLERYVALVHGSGRFAGQYLVDIKLACPSALAPHTGVQQPRWPHEARRVAAIQGTVQSIAPALLGAVAIGKHSYLIKEMQPTADCVDVSALNGKPGTLTALVRTMAEVTAWGHLRGCSRFGAAAVDGLADFATRAQWRRQVTTCARDAHQLVLQQWQAYTKDYDADPRRLLAALDN